MRRKSQNYSRYKPKSKWRRRVGEVIYETNTPAGKTFDIILLVVILVSVCVEMLDSIHSYHLRFGSIFYVVEWIITILFTIEYILRIISISRPTRYMFSALGIIDIISIVPTYLTHFLPGAHALLVFRALRLLRIFRIFKLTHFLSEINFLGGALIKSFRKISVFMLAVLAIIVIFGSIMYLVENGKPGFHNIPSSIYWAIVTLTTVGYGDVMPVTALGKGIASIMMLLGYCIIAVPTGIIGSEMYSALKGKRNNTIECDICGLDEHEDDARYCKRCGVGLGGSL